MWSQGDSEPESSADPAPAAANPVVSCESAVASEPRANREGRVVLGAVLAPRRYLPGRPEHERGERFPYWLKQGIQIRAQAPPVTVAVPPAWRSRAAIFWGDREVASVMRFASCPGHGWHWFVGGFHLKRKAACLPLEIRVGSRRKRVLIGINSHC